MYGCDKHVCMLPQEPYPELHPTATFIERQICLFRNLLLPSSWHYSTLLHIRSVSRLRAERSRQSRTSWLVCHPYSALKYYWDLVYLGTMFAVYLYMPFQVFYICPNYYDPFILVTDGFAFLNCCFRFMTGFVDQQYKTVVLEPKHIAVHYLKTYFITDFIGSLPLQLIRPFEDCTHPTHTVMFIFKLLRLLSLAKSWHNVFRQFQMSYITYVAIKLTVTAIMFLHWMTYIHYQVPNLCYHFYPENHLPFKHWLTDFHLHEDCLGNFYIKYTANLYLVCGLCIGAGYYTPLNQHLLPDLILSSFVGIIGLIFMMYMFSSLVRLAIYRQFNFYLFKGKYKQLEKNMVFMRLPLYLQRKIKLFLNYKFDEFFFNETAIHETINEQIKQDISLHCCKALVMNVPMFQDMPIALLNSIVFNLKRVLCLPGEIIVKYGNPGDSIHMISSGTVAVMNALGREVAHLRDGAFFGENALLHPGILRTATIIALEITELYVLDYKDFATCLQPYPHLKRRMDDVNRNKRAALLQQAKEYRLRKRQQ